MRTEAALRLEDLQGHCNSFRANCHKVASEVHEKLKCSTRCRAAWYCGSDCQQAHWKDGHKIDCDAVPKKEAARLEHAKLCGFLPARHELSTLSTYVVQK
jgi:hypothetical protein